MALSDLHPIVLVFGVCLLLINLVVSRALILDDGTTLFQKFFQSVIIWIVPYFGAGLILSLIASHHTRDEMKLLAPFPFYYTAHDGFPTTNRSDASIDSLMDGGDIGEGSCGSD